MAVFQRKHLNLIQAMYHPVYDNKNTPAMPFHFHTTDHL